MHKVSQNPVDLHPFWNQVHWIWVKKFPFSCCLTITNLRPHSHRTCASRFARNFPCHSLCEHSHSQQITLFPTRFLRGASHPVCLGPCDTRTNSLTGMQWHSLKVKQIWTNQIHDVKGKGFSKPEDTRHQNSCTGGKYASNFSSFRVKGFKIAVTSFFLYFHCLRRFVFLSC